MIIRTEHLGKHFGRVQVVNNINQQVPEGAAFALVRTNGAGKTTTMRILVNILHASTGLATVVGRNSRRLQLQDFTQISYVPENQELPERLTIAQYFDYLKALYPNWDSGFLHSGSTPNPPRPMP